MELKHTPGPWKFLEQGSTEVDGNACRPLTICSASNEDIANIYSCDDSTVSVSREEAIANAFLMSAASDLLEALICLEEAFCSLHDNMSKEERHDARLKLIAARAAIAKATGAA
jgi:hypothetical protein